MFERTLSEKLCKLMYLLSNCKCIVLYRGPAMHVFLDDFEICNLPNSGRRHENKIADLEKMIHRKIVHHDEFCYWLKLMYLFLLHPVYVLPQAMFSFSFIEIRGVIHAPD
jgi:hypothetical protein